MVIKFLVADLFLHLLFHTSLLRNIVAVQTLLSNTDRSHSVNLSLITDLPGHWMALWSVAVSFSLLVPGIGLQLTHLLWLEVAVLFLHRMRSRVGELLAELASLLAADLLTDSPRCLVTRILGRLPTDHLLPIAAISFLLLAAIKVEGVYARHVVNYNFLRILAEQRFHVTALEVVPLADVNIVGGVADPVLYYGALLPQVFFSDGIVVYALLQAADQLVNIEADPVHLGFHSSSTVLMFHLLTVFYILGDAGLLRVFFALVHKHSFLLHTAILVLLAITIAVSFQVWIVLRQEILGWWSSGDLM